MAGIQAMAGGKKRIPWQVQVGLIAVSLLVLWAVAGDPHLFVVAGLLGAAVGWACFRDWGNVALAVAVLVLASLLADTSLGVSMCTVSAGVKSLGDVGVDSVTRVKDQLPDYQQVTTSTAAPRAVGDAGSPGVERTETTPGAINGQTTPCAVGAPAQTGVQGR